MKYISKEEYLEAKTIVDAYNEQLRLEEKKRVDDLNEMWKKKEKWCVENGGHDYRPSGGIWSSTTERTCSFCNKKIE